VPSLNGLIVLNNYMGCDVIRSKNIEP